MRYFTLVICLLFTLTATAQIRKGDRLLTMNGSANIPILQTDNLGGVIFIDEFSAAIVYASPTYGFALSDRFVLGSSLLGLAAFGDGEGETGLMLIPYLRYYGINTEKLGLFGELSYGVVVKELPFEDSNANSADAISFSAGLQLPLGSGLRFGPTVSYAIRVPDDRVPNTFYAGAGFELVLGSNDESEAAPVAGFGKGTLMLGTQLASVTFQRFGNATGFNVGGHYFLTDRFTASASLGFNRSSTEFDLPTVSTKQISENYSFGVGSRYYFTTERHVVWFAEAGLSYQIIREKEEINTNSSIISTDFFRVGIAAGAQLFVRENVALEVGPQLNRLFIEDFGTTFLSLNVGARFLL